MSPPRQPKAPTTPSPIQKIISTIKPNMNGGSNDRIFFIPPSGISNIRNIPLLDCAHPPPAFQQSYPLPSPRSTPKVSAQPMWQRNRSRSQLVKSATCNLTKETNLLRKKLDRIVQSYEEFVTEHEKVQSVRYQQLIMQNQQLQYRLQDKEIQNMKQINDITSYEDNINQLEKQCTSLSQQVDTLKEDKQTLLEQVSFWKESLSHYRERDNIGVQNLEKVKSQLLIENEKLNQQLIEAICRFDEKDLIVENLVKEVERLNVELQDKENSSESPNPPIFPSLKNGLLEKMARDVS